MFCPEEKGKRPKTRGFHVLRNKTNHLLFPEFSVLFGFLQLLHTLSVLDWSPSDHSSILNRYPVNIIEAATIETKIAISSFFSTFLRIITSGRETTVTDIRNAREVPIGKPFPIRLSTIGMIAITFE
jgi:hypothetical protein